MAGERLAQAQDRRACHFRRAPDGQRVHRAARRQGRRGWVGLKVSKAGGLTKRSEAAGHLHYTAYIISVQDTVGSDITFTAIVHLGQTVPKRNLRCILECRDMVTLKTADEDFPVCDGHVVAPSAPGLVIAPRLDVLGEPVASYF